MYDIDGDKLRSAREGVFLSQRQLSIESGVAHSTISKIEAGKWDHAVRGLTVRKLATALDVDPGDIASIASNETTGAS